MATKIDSEYPLSPTNDESSDGEEGSDNIDNNYKEIQYKKPENNNFANILKRLESTGALLRKPKIEKEYHCYTCEQDFDEWVAFEKHLIQHVSLPSVVLDKLPSDEEDTSASGDESWSDDEAPRPQSKSEVQKTLQKLDISQILKKTGICIEKAPDTNKSPDAALNKLSGLGFTIKKNSTSIQKERVEESEPKNKNDLMKKLGNLGGLKLKLRSEGCNSNSFKVINGLKDFKASDDEDEFSENEEEPCQVGKSRNKNQEDGLEPDSEDEEKCFTNNRQNSEIQMNLLQGKQDKTEPNMMTRRPKQANKNSLTVLEGLKVMTMELPNKEAPLAKPAGRPSIKQTPKRSENNPVLVKTQESTQTIKTDSLLLKELQCRTPEKQESSSNNVVVKTEAQESTKSDINMSNAPLSIAHVKSESSSPLPLDRAPTPIISRIKVEPEAVNMALQVNSSSTNPTVMQTSSLLPVSKTEDTSMTVIEINGDSNDEDDDCCVVSSTPAPNVKPVVPKVENPTSLPAPSYPTSFSSAAQSVYSSSTTASSRLSSMLSTEKQHNFDWNAPDSKSAIDTLEKSADEIFESLLSSSTKKENMSLLDVSEYISLDTLGPQHSCEICNTRFTDISLLEEHKRLTGHSNSLATPSVSSTLLPYNTTPNILSSLLPVKQLAEQVGKIATISNSNSGFTHQQNVMINIQAYPGSGGVIVPPQPYNSYPPGHSAQAYPHPQPPNNMYTAPGPPISSQYPGSNYAQTYSQYQNPTTKAAYPGPMPPDVYANASAPYSTASPLQNMQQSIYGHTDASGMMNQQPIPLGPPGSSPSQVYSTASSSSVTKQSNAIKIQNVQTFPPGQIVGSNVQSHNPNQPITPGQQIALNQQSMNSQEMLPGHPAPGQMAPPGQIRMAVVSNVTSIRPRISTIRGARPSVKPGLQLHGHVRGGKQGPRMSLKRANIAVGGPVQKKRPDMLLPGKHDNEDCHVMAMQKQREGMPLIQSVQGAKDKLNIGSQITMSKKPVNREANAMANVLASRGISIKQKQKSRSPSPQRPLPNIPNLGAGVSIKHSSRSSNFSIPEAKIGGGMLSCKICKKMFMNSAILSVHMVNAHPQNKIPMFKCDECPAAYPKSLQLQHHKRVFHNVTGVNRELGLPVVDLSQEDNLKRLSNLGIYSFIPLANREQANGCFGIPVISVHNVQNGMTTSLQALGADGLLSLGPLKPLPNS